MLTIEDIKRHLADRNINEVARRTGLHPNIIHRILNDKSKPSYDTMLALTQYINGDSNNA